MQRNLPAYVGSGSRLCENVARYDCTQNFEACGHVQSKKMQKFILRSALRPNQISFLHGLGQLQTHLTVRAWTISLASTGRTSDASSVNTATVPPESVVNSAHPADEHGRPFVTKRHLARLLIGQPWAHQFPDLLPRFVFFPVFFSCK